MSLPSARLIAASLLAALLCASRLDAQVPADRVSFAVFGGLGAGRGVGEGSGVSGSEIRVPVAGPVAASLVLSRWWFVAGCDQVVGAPCEDGAWALDLGAAIRVTPVSWAWQVAITPRLGRLRYGADRAVWTPSIGLEAGGLLTGWAGWRAGVSYHAFDGSSGFAGSHRPPRGHQLVLRGGLAVHP